MFNQLKQGVSVLADTLDACVIDDVSFRLLIKKLI